MTPVETVQALYDAFAERDLERAAALLHPEVVWVQAAGFPGGGRHVGRAEVADKVLRGVRTGWRGFRADLSEILAAGDRVLALGAYRVLDRDGHEVIAPFAHVYGVRDGLIRTFDQFTDTAVLAAVREAP